MTEETKTPSVSELRKRFEGKSKPQTPVEFQARAQAARHNLAVRMQQVALSRKQKKEEPNPLEDVRLIGLTEIEITEFLEKAVGEYTDKLKSLSDALNADVAVGDPDVDQLSLKELMKYIQDNNGDLDNCRSLANYRMHAHKLKQGKITTNQPTTDDDGEYTFFIPQLADALSSGNDDEINRTILQLFFEEFDKSRLPDIDSLLDRYRGQEDELFAELAWEFPEHANKLVTFSINATYGEYQSATQGSLASTAKRRPSYIVSAMRS